MAGLISQLKRFSRTPQGQRAIAAARQAANDPRKRAQAQRLLSRLRGRR
ncbi:hypothetical protein [Streptomyces sp. JJ36]|nr:hypothetical protein [Streptomyces sp. JJ36]MCF6522839.1 hypothetical protein [Streptomyces sp. JJ36]